MSEATTITRCSNCGAEKSGEFCAVCGQNSTSYLRAVHRVVGDWLSESFDFDARVWLTLKHLIFTPGFLSREFELGRRARYVSPARLYLFVSLLFFFLISVFGDLGSGVSLEVDPARVETEREVRPFEQQLGEKIEHLRENPERASEMFLENVPIAMFFMIPLFALLLKGFYRRTYYTVHFVFVMHLQTFLFLAFAVSALLPDVFWLDTAMSTVNGLYMFLALRGAYREGWGRTLVKGAALGGAYLVLLALVVSGAFIYTAYLF